MARCTVCNHEQVESINSELMAGTTLDGLVEKYGVSRAALHRHKQNHLTGQIAKVQQAQLSEKTESVMTQVLEISKRANDIYEQSAMSDNPSLGLRALKELRETTSLCAKLTGELREGLTVINQNMITTSPEWLSMRTSILRALTPYPEAKKAVIRALGGLYV